MSLDALHHSVLALIRTHIALVEPIVFLMGFAEGIPALSLFVPSSALFLAIGGVHSAAGGGFWNVWLAAAVGAVVGDLVTYSLGRWLKDDVARLRYLAIHPEVLAKGRGVFERWGVLAVFGGKFTGFMRPFIPVVAGIVQMPFPLFLVASSVSSLAWAGAFLAPGYGIKWLVD
ncbi:MAG: DedA family protein [Hyphomicrobiaceae bacterium]|nr:DedA family protein [Hyphomicrobiaceae bacterium]